MFLHDVHILTMYYSVSAPEVRRQDGEKRRRSLNIKINPENIRHEIPQGKMLSPNKSYDMNFILFI